jgi:hypothetical protein
MSGGERVPPIISAAYESNINNRNEAFIYILSHAGLLPADAFFFPSAEDVADIRSSATAFAELDAASEDEAVDDSTSFMLCGIYSLLLLATLSSARDEGVTTPA